MTMYAGEEVKISVTAIDFDSKTVLTSDYISTVRVTIYDKTPAVVISNATMSYDTTNKLWFYMWDTTGLAVGSYKAKVVMVGLDDKPSWEWKRIRLAKDLVTV